MQFYIQKKKKIFSIVSIYQKAHYQIKLKEHAKTKSVFLNTTYFVKPKLLFSPKFYHFLEKSLAHTQFYIVKFIFTALPQNDFFKFYKKVLI